VVLLSRTPASIALSAPAGVTARRADFDEPECLTGDGLRFAIFYTKLHDRLLRPLLAAEQPPAPPLVRKALRTIAIHISECIDQTRLLPKVA